MRSVRFQCDYTHIVGPRTGSGLSPPASGTMPCMRFVSPTNLATKAMRRLAKSTRWC